MTNRILRILTAADQSAERRRELLRRGTEKHRQDPRKLDQRPEALEEEIAKAKRDPGDAQ